MGRNDLCPCGSARRFKRIAVCTAVVTTASAVTTTIATAAATERGAGTRLSIAATPA
ncbi:SEC-C metal-binding domain-containing protein [Lysobacter firmicutimachus]|uniref:SEC-C metal-binding domain-containing protein n=1 Tax=Lysobacter firmicutimachus TaxID=1792846 RepID=UPI003CE4D7D9